MKMCPIAKNAKVGSKFCQALYNPFIFATELRTLRKN